MNAATWRGLVAVVTTATFGAGWTAGFLMGLVDAVLYLAGMGPLVMAVSSFYFANELKNGVKQYDKLMKDVVYMERAKEAFDRYIAKKHERK